MESLSNKGKRCFIHENNKFRSYRKDQQGNLTMDGTFSVCHLNAEFYVKHPNIILPWTVCRSQHVCPSVNEKRDSLLLLHIMTITHTFSQDNSTLEKFVIVMGLGLLGKTLLHSLLRLIYQFVVFCF